MDDIIAIVIVIAGVLIKVFSGLKKNVPESPEENWEQYFELSEPESEAEMPTPRSMSGNTTAAAAQTQYEVDSALLEEQQCYARMAEQAEAMNQASAAEEDSVIYQAAVSDEAAEEDDPVDWVELIRHNRTEAVVISEILAPPPSLR